jgi:hypothetical protein
VQKNYTLPLVARASRRNVFFASYENTFLSLFSIPNKLARAGASVA